MMKFASNPQQAPSNFMCSTYVTRERFNHRCFCLIVCGYGLHDRIDEAVDIVIVDPSNIYTA